MAPKKKAATKTAKKKEKEENDEEQEEVKEKKVVKKKDDTKKEKKEKKDDPPPESEKSGRKVAPAEPMPTLLSGSVVETLRDTEFFRSATCGSILDIIPTESVLKISEQSKSTKEICMTSFAGKQGYIRIIDNSGKLSIRAAEKKTLSINFKNVGPIDDTANKVMAKYEISEGQIIEALYLLNMRTGEDLDSDYVAEIEPRSKVVILKVGQGRRVRVRKLDQMQCGWVSAMDTRGKPLLGYVIADDGSAAEYEVGARLEVKTAVKFTVDETRDSATIGHTVKPGSIVIVQAIGRGALADRKVQVCTEDRRQAGWVYCLGPKGTAVLGACGQSKDAGKSNVKQFLEAAKANDISGLSELLGLTNNSRSIFSALKAPSIKDPNVADIRGKTALSYAAGYGHFETVKFLCGLASINVNMADDFDRTPLHYACKRMPGAPFRENIVYARICETLIDHGARVDDADGHGATAIMFAAFVGDLETCKMLVEHQADVTRMTFNKRTATIMAAINGYRTVVSFLLANGGHKEDADLLESSEEEYEPEPTTTASGRSNSPGKSKSKPKAKAAKGKAKGKAKGGKAKAKAQIMKEMGLGAGDDNEVETDDLAEQLAELADKPDELKKLLEKKMKLAPKMKYSDLSTMRTLAREVEKLDMGDGPDVKGLHSQLAKMEAVDKMGEELKELVDQGGDTKKVKKLMTEAKKGGLPDGDYALTSAAEYLEKEKPKDEMKAKLRALGDKGDFAGLEKMVEEAEQGILGAGDLEEFREILRAAANLDEAKEKLADAMAAKDVEQLRICIPMVEKFKGDVSKAKAVLAEEEPKYEARKKIADACETKDVNEMKTVLALAKKVKVPDEECRELENFIKAFEGLEKAVADTKNVAKDSEDDLLKAKTTLAAAIKQAREVGVSEPDLLSAETMRKKYHNMLEDLKGAIRVFCRVRPISRKEIDQGDSEVTKPVDGMTIELKGDAGAEQFMFDAVWTPGSQEAVFEDTKDLIQSAIDGYNVTIFAYGQTGAGKTFTMTGVPGENRGVIPRSCVEIFDLLKAMEKTFNFTVMVKMLELYNSDLRDLLAKDKDKAPVINVRLDKKGVVVIEGVANTQVNDAAHLDSTIDGGFHGRTVKATAMNSESSRSHLVVIITIVSVNKETNKTTEGKLLLVDLAGSERIKKSEVTGAAQKEAIEINKSLTALGNVIESLTTGSKNIPYRDHKLTMLMQDALGGTSKTLMFMNCSPAKSNIDETTMSLKYAQRAKKIVNKR